ncbi:MAG TPA: hypothetical protein PLV58_09220 [Campylobacterales bacterium]|nr:hypothetical protein [Campylobacterales bacterium]
METIEYYLTISDSEGLLAGEKQRGRRFEWFDIKTDEIAVKAAKEMLGYFLNSKAVK